MSKASRKTRKPRMGRPPLPLAARLDTYIVVRLTKAERQRLLAAARERGVSASVVVRDALSREWEEGK